eukprot:CAMPEP_0175845286 /NCGR_PEP_ID=MMETSP0107_2-20121207/22132_1 /TAXON_ID=195067 ORGANISM="Goniomonas pacifica, Strain CCMP1869" /NCGR_SAMPLE_ID=MMETSP0107_2 /ASSEMBLY_ACC=CAM_ASM_000203 /LENGTH=124 /DNA_ID=CAMNT_0017159811 /DNA_START=11 /DNA_END=385 /DNA_ORIENTATION=+
MRSDCVTVAPALQEAAQSGNVNEIRRLLAAGANINADVHDRAPLHLSALNGHLEVCQMLVGAGANVNATNLRGSTPLHYSGFNGHMEVSQMLVGAGADVNAPDPAVRRRYPLPPLSPVNGWVDR